MGNTADVGPKVGSRAAKDANIRSDMIFDDVGCAPSNLLYLPGTWCHVELPGLLELKSLHNHRIVRIIWGEKDGISSRRIQHHLNEKKNC